MMLKGDDLAQFLILRSLPLRRLGPDHLPVSMASGCMTDYLGWRWVLSVSHAVKDGENWAVEVGYDATVGQTKLWQLGQVNCAKLGSLISGETRELDLVYVRVPNDLTPVWRPTDERGQPVDELPREPVPLNFDGPTRKGTYGFAGNLKEHLERHGDQVLHEPRMVAYPSLRYVGDEGEYHVFELPLDRPGDEWLKGTSGAPILNSTGEAVALVCGPSSAENAIQGISMRLVRPLLEAAGQKYPR